MKKEVEDPSDVGLLPDGLPTTEEAKEFLEFAQEIEKIIKKELV
ncbi:hypothetical protein NO2_1306 [Candidatus Termititenax persephonae]|uniref:HEPN domain-containing protein n=1 Tax=Candidatus Termititenax persephonae TaxID=2218525 RepID=A0A388TK01_9BACT|nr:hypothetical protein NO2_1306 [Candidatus Termititenax persephonae]